MKKWFLICFIVSIVALVFFLGIHFYNIMNMMKAIRLGVDANEPVFFFQNIMSPFWIFSFVLLVISSLAYQIIGIVTVAKNSAIDSSEKVIWVIGFILFGFITAIVFLALDNTRKFFAPSASSPALKY